MEIIRDTTSFQLDKDSALAIGKFDGVHLGHRKLLDELTSAKERLGLNIVIFTFDPSPARFFGKGDVKELMTAAEKRRQFEELNADVLIEFPLNRETAAIEAEAFVREYLVGKLRCRMIAAGGDLSFGYRGAGNFALLERMAKTYDYTPLLIEKVFYEDTEISSTRIREAVSAGRMEEASDMLGEPYTISGVVSEGRKLGRTIGFPTANVCPPDHKLLPPYGVYFTRTHTPFGVKDGITNIGVKPTVSDLKLPTAETYLFDCDFDLYGQEITTELLRFHRHEKRFDGVDALKEQIARDTEEAKSFFSFT